MAKRNRPTVMGYLSSIGENLETLAKDPKSSQSLKEAQNCYVKLMNLLGIPGICKFGIPQPKG